MTNKICLRTQAMLITLLVALSLTILLYGQAARLPFYADDLQQIPWVKATPALNYWFELGPYEDYRPVRFMLLRGLYVLTGDLDPVLLHVINLFGHILCALFVSRLAMDWDADPRLTGPLTAAFFVLFPFASNAVLWVSAISYSLTAALGMAALLVYRRARDQDNPWVHGAALLLTLTAGLVYEGGIVGGAAVLWAELVLYRRPFCRWAPAHLVVSLIPASVITAFSTAVPTAFLTGLHPHLNLVALLQALAYPVAPAATEAARLGPGSAVIWMTVLGALTVLGLGLWHFFGERRGWLLFSLGWVAIWLVMPLTTQPFNWFRDPNRSFYPSSMGIALLWSLSAAGLVWARKAPGWRYGVAVLISAAMLATPFGFVQDVVRIHLMTSELLWDAVSTARTTPDALIVNLPGRVTPAQRRYPLMHEGFIPIPPPTDGEMFIAVHTPSTSSVTTRAFGEILPPDLPYSLELADPPLTYVELRSASAVEVAAYGPSSMGLVSAGRIQEASDRHGAAASFGDALVLREATCRWKNAEDVVVEFVWEAVRDVNGSPTVFTHWLNPEGALEAQADGAALRGLYPISAWQPGEIIHDVRVIEGVESRAGGVSVGVWDPVMGVRLPAVDGRGAPLVDNAYRLPGCGEAGDQESKAAGQSSVIDRQSQGLASGH